MFKPKALSHLMVRAVRPGYGILEQNRIPGGAAVEPERATLLQRRISLQIGRVQTERAGTILFGYHCQLLRFCFLRGFLRWRGQIERAITLYFPCHDLGIR
jgi:hypothetical protein